MKTKIAELYGLDSDNLTCYAGDGGGGLGCGTLEWLVLAEKAGILPKDDVLAGTSVWAMIALKRAMGCTWAEIDNFFRKWVEKIFETHVLWTATHLWCPTYSPAGMEAACLAAFGNAKMSDLQRPVFAVVCNSSTGKPKIFDNTDKDWLVRDVAIASAAALTYFPPRITPLGHLIDGGFVQNNPSFIAVDGILDAKKIELPAAKARRDACDGIKVLSFDTGSSYWKDPNITEHTLITSLPSPMVRVGMYGNEEIAAHHCHTFLGEQHLRISPECCHNYEMDDMTCLDAYRGIWRDEFTAGRADFEAWAK